MRVVGIGLLAAGVVLAGTGCALQTASDGGDDVTHGAELSAGANVGRWEGASTVLPTSRPTSGGTSGTGQGVHPDSSGEDDHPDPQPWAPPLPGPPRGPGGHPDPAPWNSAALGDGVPSSGPHSRRERAPSGSEDDPQQDDDGPRR